MPQVKKSPKTDSLIANYELNDYSYTQFWQGRAYEDKAERLAIRNLLGHRPRGWFVDIGGSYGRLLNEYAPHYEHIAILDYATNDFPFAVERAKELDLDIELIAANAYHMPFPDNSIAGGISVRVMHHLPETEKFFAELYRVMQPGGVFVLEFANKFHLKAILRHLFKLDFSFFNNEVYRVPHRSDAQGIDTEKGQESVIFNYPTRHVVQKLKKVGFCVEQVVSVSWCRFPLLKKIVPTAVLLFIERLMQALFSWTKLTPSIFLQLQKPVLSEKREEAEAIEELLVDPSTFQKLKGGALKKASLTIKDRQGKQQQVWDLRTPRPEEVDY